MNVWEAYRPLGAWRVGDCSMLGGYSPTGASEDMLSHARIVQPDANGQSWVYIFGATETFASPTDVWWTTLTFYTRFGVLLSGGHRATERHVDLAGHRSWFAWPR